MNSSIIATFVANPSVLVMKLFVEALPGAAIAYAVMWWILRPRDGRKVPGPFLRHALGVFLSVAGGALFRVIAMATFAGRGAFETAPETGAAAFYVLVVPAVVAAGYIVWLKRQLSNPSGSRTTSESGNDGYAKALAEIEEGRLDKGVWARAFADAGGEESKAKALYIKARAGAIQGAEVWENTQPPESSDARPKATGEKATVELDNAAPVSAPKWPIWIVAGALPVYFFVSLAVSAFKASPSGQAVAEATTGSQPMAQVSPDQDKVEITPQAKPVSELNLPEFSAESQKRLKDQETIRRADVDFNNAYSALEHRAYGDAFNGFRSLALQGDARGQVSLGSMYYNGDGVAKSYAEAVKWYRLAAAQGNPTAQSNLGAMYALGQGVSQNILLAHMWLNLSAAAGNLDAANVRDTATEKLMTPQQISLAQKMARDCQQRNFKGCD
jgi:hypothetical protein